MHRGPTATPATPRPRLLGKMGADYALRRILIPSDDKHIQKPPTRGRGEFFILLLSVGLR